VTGLDTPSFGQQRLWFVDRMEPGSALYNVPVAVLRPVFEERAGEPVLLAACAGLLSRYRGQDDVVIRPAVGGRPSPETEHLIGLFVNTMPPRVPVAGNPTFRELPSRVCDVTLDGLGYAGTPFERVVETVAPQRDLGHAPIYQAQLNRQSTPPLRLPGVTPAEPELVHTRTATVDLTFRFAGRDGRLGADLEYSFDLFDPDTAERRIAHLPAFLPAAATDPEVPVALCLERSAALVDAATRSRPAGLLGRLAGRPGERAGLARRRLRRRQGRGPGAHSGGPDRSSAAQCAGASLRATQLAVRTG
jgi:non-ribosomal peptide synthetase component F